MSLVGEGTSLCYMNFHIDILSGFGTRLSVFGRLDSLRGVMVSV